MIAMGATALAVAIHMHVGNMAVAAARAGVAAMSGSFYFHGRRESQRAAAFVTEAKQ
ncbi:MAG: hypothetical protein ACT4O2_13685 [Beijerinckiaceae bacterium]